MKYAPLLALGLVFGFGAAPALAQMGPGGGLGGMGGAGGGPAPQPQAPESIPAPAALPGAGGAAPLATGPNLQKPVSGDPTQALFDAVNKGDYNAAQAAISQGANLNATDQFGETPLDLSIALNRTGITFLLLGTRNETAGTQNEVMGSPWLLNSAPPASGPKPAHHHAVAAPRTPAREELQVKTPAPVAATPGTPNANAGFLGFGAKN
jgi:hypothetical protein